MFGLNKTYTINFITNCSSEIESIQLKNKQEIPELQAPTKDGYNFAGWFVDEKCETAFTLEKMEKKDVTLYAKWAPMSMEEFLNEVNFYTKSANILQNLQNDYSDVPQFKDEGNKDNKTTKKKAAKKKTTKTKKGAKNQVENNNEVVDELEENTVVEETVELESTETTEEVVENNKEEN